jgi:hypothetical protein
MTSKHPTGKYSVTLDALEASAHVPVDDQVAEQPEAPAADAVSAQEVERQVFLRIAGAP